MLQEITDGVWIHKSKFLESNAVIVQGENGVLLIDPGITTSEMVSIADELDKMGRVVEVGFSTHPHWDHLLWHSRFGNVPRYSTDRGKKDIDAFLSNPDWKTQVTPMLPPNIADQIPMDSLFGKVTALPAEITQISWDGPSARVISNNAHATGGAIITIEDKGVLIAGDMVSDILIPFLELDSTDPVKDYIAALELIKRMASSTKVFVPGHGSTGDKNELLNRIEQDQTYVETLGKAAASDDARLKVEPNGNVDRWQREAIASKLSETFS